MSKVDCCSPLTLTASVVDEKIALRKEVTNLIADEQRRQKGNFVPDGLDYLCKLANKAEVLFHEFSGKCRGFIFFYCNDPEKSASYITLIMVDPDFRKSGIGAALVQYVLNLTAQRGFKVCRLEVRKENAAAIKLYETMGFFQIEERSEKYLMEAQIS